jgi:hypothetical protein
MSRPQGHSGAGRVRSIEKIHLLGTRTRDLPTCSIVPEPTTLPRAPVSTIQDTESRWETKRYEVYEKYEVLTAVSGSLSVTMWRRVLWYVDPGISTFRRNIPPPSSEQKWLSCEMLDQFIKPRWWQISEAGNRDVLLTDIWFFDSVLANGMCIKGAVHSIEASYRDASLVLRPSCKMKLRHVSAKAEPLR